MRWGIALTLAVVGVAVAPALAAAPMTITAGPGLTFSPSTVTIDPGDTVTFTSAGGFHNVVFDDGSGSYPAAPAYPWPSGQQRTFTVPGTYTFHCGNPDHAGMTGVIRVGPAGPSPAPSPEPQPGTGPPPPGTGPPPLVRDVHLAGARFCIRHCRHPGVTLKLELTRAARVRGTLTRRGRRFGRVDFGTVAAGRRTLRFTHTTARRRLSRGRYALALRIGAERARTLRFGVS